MFGSLSLVQFSLEVGTFVGTFVKDKKGAQWLLSRLCLSRDDQNRAVNSYRNQLKWPQSFLEHPKQQLLRRPNLYLTNII